ncbi:hypothetical protein [Methanosalsum natronophilum]|uniref:hypothetical protein n=1 Tax=Methanosalsum natronophilum TaxID=768733 RepID=UPI002168E279|nr:hypothetical protein [Methanosalsum natronophilum]MCS3924428.1 hypothetical protein [Methanosalsum natronophilum]
MNRNSSNDCRGTEIEVILDIDKLPNRIGTMSPSGKLELSDQDVRTILTWAEKKIDTEYPITVVIRGFCPHFLLVRLQHLIEMYSVTGSVTRYDFVPFSGPRIIVFDHSQDHEVLV